MEEKIGSPAVPAELLDLHVQLEEAGVTPEDFKAVYDVKGSLKDRMGSTKPEGYLPRYTTGTVDLPLERPEHQS